IRGKLVTGVQTCALPISAPRVGTPRGGCDRVSAPRRCSRAPVGESVVPTHAAPVRRRRGDGRARARRAGGRLVPGRGDGYAQREIGRASWREGGAMHVAA